MKLSEAPGTAASVHIQAPPDRVWAVATDLPRFGQWSPENRGGRWLDGADGQSVGHRFEGTQEHPAVGTWTTVATIVECDPCVRYSWIVGTADDPGATWLFTFEATDDGTRLDQRVTIGPGPSGISVAIEAMPDKEDRILQRRLEEHDRGMAAVLDGIKHAAEGSG
jgi:uncharacterized protein YndB with AHSA1/START domain